MIESFRLLAKKLGDPELTASFQRKCGVKHITDFNDGNSVNGNNVASASAGVGNNTHLDSPVPFNQVNGKIKSSEHGINGVLTPIASNHSNGYLKERKQINHNHHNGYLKNGTNGVKLDEGEYKSSCNGDVGRMLNGNGFIQKNGVKSLKDHSIDNVIIHWLFLFGASLGNELFYILFFSFSLWNLDSVVIRRTIIVWGVIMYVGQAAKDIIMWPRPKSPPVIPLEKRYELEYGMPSTHAMVGVGIPFSVFIFMYGRYEFNLVLSLFIAITWCLLVSFSRLYLGMHSVLDVIAGVSLAAFLMLVTVPFVDSIDRFILSSKISIPVVMSTCILLSWIYPSMKRWSTTRGDTILILGVFSGIYSGLWMTGQLSNVNPTPEALPLTLALPTLSGVGIALIRQILGSIFIFLALTAIKKIILYTLSWILGYDPKDPVTKQQFNIELPYRYLPYFIGGIVATYVMPLIFQQIHLEREGFYSEIFSYSS
uniref:Phosphatidic acid phosphatase type 2/haloperoxidase domain-containing protein n=1 Tax=Biomphalaria glabrata TaxID=6526 RepID=A0A2C9JVA6_BIOGL